MILWGNSDVTSHRMRLSRQTVVMVTVKSYLCDRKFKSHKTRVGLVRVEVAPKEHSHVVDIGSDYLLDQSMLAVIDPK